MKILYIVTRSDTIGGVHTHLLELLKNISYKSDILVVAGYQGGYSPFFEALDGLGINHAANKYLSNSSNILTDIRCLFSLFSLIRSFSPSLVALHSSKAGVLGRVVCFVLKVKCIFTVHGWSFNSGTNMITKFAYYLLEYVLHFFSSCNICVSKLDLIQARSLGFRDSKLIHIPNTAYHSQSLFDFESFNSSRRFNFLDILCIARFDKQKDQLLLIRALSLIDKKRWSLTFVGDGPTLNTCKKLSTELGVSGNIVFTGFITDVSHFFQKSNLFILPSKWEGLPITLIEALSAGLPIIGSNVGGVSECVNHGFNGFLTKKNSLSSLHHHINYLAYHPDRLIPMTESSRSLFDKKFSSSHFLNPTFSLYAKVTNQIS